MAFIGYLLPSIMGAMVKRLSPESSGVVELKLFFIVYLGVSLVLNLGAF